MSDRTKFKIIANPSADHIAKIEESFNNYLKSITDVDKNYFNPIKRQKDIRQKTYQQIRSKGARCGIACVLTKIHKKENPLRSIISKIEIYNYETFEMLKSSRTEDFKFQSSTYRKSTFKDVMFN